MIWVTMKCECCEWNSTPEQVENSNQWLARVGNESDTRKNELESQKLDFDLFLEFEYFLPFSSETF